MIAALGLVIGIVLGVLLQPVVPFWLQPYLPIAVVAALDLGGDLGFSGNVASPESGFTTGLIKSLLLEYAIMREQKGFLAKAVDAPRGEAPDELAANILRELAHGTNDYEVSFVGGQRYLQVALPEHVKLESTSTIRPGGTWVLTGGARGITAECGLELARRFGLRLHLIGTTPAAAIDRSWRDLDEKQTAALRGQVIVEARKRGEKPNEAWARVAKAIEIDARDLTSICAEGLRYLVFRKQKAGEDFRIAISNASALGVRAHASTI